MARQPLWWGLTEGCMIWRGFYPASVWGFAYVGVGGWERASVLLNSNLTTDLLGLREER